jgi:hypothetical protein
MASGYILNLMEKDNTTNYLNYALLGYAKLNIMVMAAQFWKYNWDDVIGEYDPHKNYIYQRKE